MQSLVFVKTLLSQKRQYISLKNKRPDDKSPERVGFTGKLGILGIGL